MSPDPGWFFAGRLANPQSLNQYNYVFNNPLRFVDPFGLEGASPTATCPTVILCKIVSFIRNLFNGGDRNKSNSNGNSNPNSDSDNTFVTSSRIFYNSDRTTVQVSPFGNTVYQAGGSVGTFGGNLSYVPSTGTVYGTPTVGASLAPFAIYGGGGPTTVVDLDQSGYGLSVSGFSGVGAGVSTYLSGATTKMVGLGTPDLGLAHGFTFKLGSLPPATFNVNVNSVNPATAVPIGDGLYTDDEPWQH